MDTVFLFEVLEHLEDPAEVLREARRVARRNVLLSTPELHAELRAACRSSSATCSTSTTGSSSPWTRWARCSVRCSATITVEQALPARRQDRRAGPAAPAARAQPLARPPRPACDPRYFFRLLRPLLGRVTRVLFISAEPLGAAMAGPAIRVLELAKAVAGRCEVTVAAPGPERPGRRAARALIEAGLSDFELLLEAVRRRTTWWWPSGCRRSCCASWRACPCASWPTSTTRR